VTVFSEICPMIRRLPYIYGMIVLLLAGLSSSGQDRSTIAAEEDTLRVILSGIRAAGSDTEKMALNERFLIKLRQVLMLRASVSYPFDSLKSVARLSSPDNRFRAINWNLPMEDGTNRYYGLIQVPSGQKEAPHVVGLHDWSDVIDKPEEKKLDTAHWYGALYYKIILCRTANRTYYTLLGWDGMSPQMTQKIIEILYFDTRGIPVFGSPVFRNYSKEKKFRIIFRYSAASTMVLKYDEQTVVKKKKWNSRKRTYEMTSDKYLMIVCDRLIPVDPAFEGNPAFYVPAGDAYDGFQFSNGYWNFIKNVDARNPARKSSRRAR